MGTEQRAEGICTQLQLQGWKRKIARRALTGCGNCSLRYACMSKILDGRDYSAGLLRTAISIMTRSSPPESTPERVSWVAKEVANAMRMQCAQCDGLGLCLANAHFAAWGSPMELGPLRASTRRLEKNIRAGDFPQRVQDVLNLSGVSTPTLIKRVFACFITCRQRASLGEGDE